MFRRWLKEQTLLEYLLFVVVVGVMFIMFFLNLLNYQSRGHSNKAEGVLGDSGKQLTAPTLAPAEGEPYELSQGEERK